MAKRLPPRERILEAAEELFYANGIRGVGVEAIAEQAGTNKMALYRHFESKDELVAAWLRTLVDRSNQVFSELEATYPEDPMGHLIAWFRVFAQRLKEKGIRGCPFANTMVELPDPEHPARLVIEEHKARQRGRMIRLCEAAGMVNPNRVADELFFLFEGVHASAQSLGAEEVADRFLTLAEALIAERAEEGRKGA